MKAPFLPLHLILILSTLLFGCARGQVNSSRQRPNILIVSACSIRKDKLKSAPHFADWAKGAFVFENAVAERPWENFRYYSVDRITPSLLESNGYSDFNLEVPPPRKEANKNYSWYYYDSDVLNYKQGLEDLRRLLTSSRSRAFYVFAHFKYMHYPYFDSVNLGNQTLAQLTPASRSLFQKYISKPASFPDKLPLIELMLNNMNLLKKYLKIKSSEKIWSAAGVISNVKLTRAWTNSKDYLADLQLAKELYEIKLRRLDEFLPTLLNLFDDPSLKSNTIVVFTGDHGEAFLEHGVLGHSVNTYEEMLDYPLIVKFPNHGKKEPKPIFTQATHETTVDLLAGIIQGKITENNFAEEARRLSPDYVLSRNCEGTIRSVRYQNKWKFINNISSGSNELYDLARDPNETSNVIEDHPDISWRLEEYWIDHYDELKHENYFQKGIGLCTVD